MNKKSLHYKCKNKSNDNLLDKSDKNIYNRLIYRSNDEYFYNKNMLSSHSPYIFFSEKNNVRQRVIPLSDKNHYIIYNNRTINTFKNNINDKSNSLSYNSMMYASLQTKALAIVVNDPWEDK